MKIYITLFWDIILMKFWSDIFFLKFEFSLHLITIKLPSWIKETLCPNAYSIRTNYKKNQRESKSSFAFQVLILKNPYFSADLKIRLQFLSETSALYNLHSWQLRSKYFSLHSTLFWRLTLFDVWKPILFVYKIFVTIC